MNPRKYISIRFFIQALLILNVCAFFSSCGFCTEVVDQVSVEEYAIYEKVIQSIHSGDNRKYYLDSQTTALKSEEALNPGAHGVSDSGMLFEFNARNRNSFPLNPPKESTLNQTLISAEEFKRKREEEKGTDVISYDCIWHVTRVGFNKDHTQAILKYVTWCSGLDAQGMVVILEKQGNEWKIVREIELWVA